MTKKKMRFFYPVYLSFITGALLLCIDDSAPAQSCGDDVCTDLNFYHTGAEPDCFCAAMRSCVFECGEGEGEGSGQTANRMVFATNLNFPHAKNMADKYADARSELPPDDAELQTYDQFWYFNYNRVNCGGAELAWAEAAARWFLEKKSKLGRVELILDGRAASSTGYGGNKVNINFFENTRANFARRGGGLFVGTDHHGPAGFETGCVNVIAVKLNFDLFYGDSPGPRAIVDFENPLMSWPQDATYALPTTEVQTINGKKYDRYINDHTTTGTVAANLQANGMFLCPVAFHGSNINAPAVSSTICGSQSADKDRISHLQILHKRWRSLGCCKSCGRNTRTILLAMENKGSGKHCMEETFKCGGGFR